jgi:threonyl-tRNA synthetase
VYRYELSGAVHGLLRSRGFTQDDSHIFCTREMVPEELASLLSFVIDVLRSFGFDEFQFKLSTKPEEKFVGDDELWEMATVGLRHALEVADLEYTIEEGGGAFYGPKIDVDVKDAIGRSWQLSTLQLDFNLPERFGLEYIGPDGQPHRPVMIHRALFGSVERFFGVLTEHYAGAFPAWLAPVQVMGIPVTSENADHLFAVRDVLRKAGIRVDVDASDDRMQKKIRNHTMQKVPFMLLAGAKDVEANAVSFRFRDGTQINGVPVERAVEQIVEWVGRRENASPTAELLS